MKHTPSAIEFVVEFVEYLWVAPSTRLFQLIFIILLFYQLRIKTCVIFN